LRSFVIAILAIFLQLSVAAAKEIVLFRWVDDEGKMHYTENYNSIPEKFRVAAIQGVFRFRDKDEKNDKIRGPKITNKMEILEDNYRQEGGFLKLTGRLRNGYATAARSINVKASFFDKNNNFLFSETTIANPLEVQPGQEASFVMEVQMQSGIDRYKLDITWK